MISPVDLMSAIYARAKTLGNGATLRAALGDSANSVLMATALQAAMGQPDLSTSLPARPFIALDDGLIAFDAIGTAQTFTPMWLIYDEPGRHYAIRQIIPLLVALYTGDGAPAIRIATGGQVGAIRIANVTRPRPDRNLGGLECSALQLQLYAI